MTLRLLTLFAISCLYLGNVFAQVPAIAVAANMKDAFAEIVMAFKAPNKAEIKVVYGSSGNFTAQIMNGAPFSLLIAADEQFPLELYKNGKTVDEGAIYAIGKLALIAKISSGIQLRDSRADIAQAIGKANKIAIAKPELAPYGRAAVQYLKAEGLWDLAKNKLVYADNIGLATTYVVTGAADLGLTALSLAKSPEVAKETSFLLIQPGSYEPIKQRMVVMKGAPPEALDLYRFMQGSQAKAILQKYGYITP
jgi:molybdate transport system substrate-binding protein